MRFSIERGARNLGREDRLVRACVALSLALMGVFVLLAARHLSLGFLGFAALAAYFAVTALLAWDPMYQHLGMDTRLDEARADGSAQPADRSDPVLALPADPSRTVDAEQSRADWGISLLGR
jgi:hypothetical protein